MAKKLNIKGVSVDYGDVEKWNGRLWTKQELHEYYEKSERDYQEARRQERDAEQEKKSARRRAHDEYQVSLDVPNNNYAPIVLSDSEIRGSALLMVAVIVGGCLLVLVLGLLTLA